MSANLDLDHFSSAVNDFSYEPAPPESNSRYNRQLLIPSISLSGQRRISQSRVLIIGLGGLGSPAALYLAGAGVGILGLLDNDIVEQSNLHRQIAHRESSVQSSLSKVASAARACRELNSDPNTRIVEHELRLSAGSELLAILEGYDIVLDCTDNPATRYLISDACVLSGKTLVSGAAQRLEGQMMVLNYNAPNSTTSRGPCYRCVFPRPPAPDMVRACSEIGILGPVVGAIGTLMASEALRIVVQGSEDRKPSMLLYNAWSMDPRSMFRAVGLRGKRSDCVACGDEDVLAEKRLQKITETDMKNGRVDYIAFCGVLEDVRLLNNEQRVSAQEFLDQNNDGNSTTRVVDVREPHEVILGPKLSQSVNIPLSKVLRGTSVSNGNSSKDQSDLHKILNDPSAKSVLFVCPRGNDSQVAAHAVLEKFKVDRGDGDMGAGMESRKFIGDVIGGFEALEKAYRARTKS